MTFHHYNHSTVHVVLFIIIIIIIIISTSTYSSHAADFCVADLRNQASSGYLCKNPANVTADDFVFSGLASRGNTTNIFNATVTRATVLEFPAVNGLNVAAGRIDIDPNGVIPLHTHPLSSEMLFVVEGTVTAGFISTAPSYTVYAKQLQKGDLMVIPQDLLHFQVNMGTQNAVIFAAFGHPEPGLQIVSTSLFGNNFPSFLVEKTTHVDSVDVIKKLKTLYGGYG